MEIMVYSKKTLFQQKFQKYCTISTGIPYLGVWCKNDPIGHPESESDKKIRLRLPVLLAIRLRLHPKISDSATLI